MASPSLLLLALVLCSGIFLACAAQDSYPVDLTNDKQPQNFYPDPAATLSWVFPSSSERKITSGQIAEFLVGFSNTHESKRFNVSRIFGFLSHPQDPSIILQNFSQIAYQTIVYPQQTSTFLYRFYPDPNLEPRDYSFSAIVNYHDGPSQYYSYIFNGTIFLEAPKEEFTPAAGFMTFAMLFGLIGLPVYIFFGKSAKAKIAKITNSSPASPSRADDTSLIPKHVLAHASKAAQSKAGKNTPTSPTRK